MLAEKREIIEILGPIKATISINPYLKSFLSASIPEFHRRLCPIRDQLDWDSGILGHTSLPRGGPYGGNGGWDGAVRLVCSNAQTGACDFHTAVWCNMGHLYKMEGIIKKKITV